MLNSLCSDSKKTIGSLFNQPVPEGLNIRTVQNTADTIHVALPHYSNQGDASNFTLSDEDLLQICGGFEVWLAALLGATFAAVGAGVAAVGAGVAAAT